MTRSWAAAIAACTLSLATLLPTAVEACGCLSPPVPAPTDTTYAVNQQAEQIVFEVEPGFVTAHILIRYAGDPASFAWIVPMPTVPAEMTLSESLLFGLLDDQTAPAVIIDTPSLCPSPEYRCQYHDFPAGCYDPSAPAGLADAGLNGSGGAGGGSAGRDADGGSEVIVHSRQQIGSYDTVVLGGGSAEAVVMWLMMNDFIVNETMAPYMQPYLDSGMVFVASRLVAGAGIDEIKPLRIKYAAELPSVPLRLTAVAAEPHLTVTTYIFADTPFEPVDRPLLGIDESWISRGPNGRSNYPMVLARAADDAGGDGFVVEFSGPPPAAAPNADEPCCDELDQCFLEGSGVCECPGQPWDAADCAETEGLLESIERLGQLASRHSVLTRLTTRISPEEMTFDPAFRPARGPLPVEGRLVLRGQRRDMQGCLDDLIDVARYEAIEDRQVCASVYCGTGECVVTEAGAACLCAPDQVARRFTDVDGLPSVTCVPREHTVDLSAGGLALPDACADVADRGSCRDVGGFPTRRCPGDMAAVLSAEGNTPSCARVTRRTGSPGARDFTAPMEGVRACAPAPPHCGEQGWLVPNENKTRQGVICPSSLAPEADFVAPAPPTCEDYGLEPLPDDGLPPRDPNDPGRRPGVPGGSPPGGGGFDAGSGGAGGRGVPRGTGSAEGGCSAAPSGGLSGGLWWLALLPLLAIQRRRQG